MRVADLMRTDVVTVHQDASITEVIERLVDAHVTGVPVVDGHGRMVGVVTTADVLGAIAERRGEAERQVLLDETLVRDVMTPRPLVIPPDADLHEAAQRLLYLGVHRLFVEEGGHLLGVLSQGDLVQALATRKV